MTNRERLLAIMDGRPPDRIPWIPRLLLWYNAHKKAGTLPARYRGMTLRQIERDLGVGTPARDGRRLPQARCTASRCAERRLSDLEELTRIRHAVRHGEYRLPRQRISAPA